MHIIPVLDLKGGHVVHGIAGRRQEYRPITSVLTSSTRPLEVARAFRDKLGLVECYIADLDAIAGAAPAFSVFADIQALGMRLCVDAGIREPGDAARLAEAGVETVIAGLETISGPEVLGAICAQLGSKRVVFSLDMKDGEILGRAARWQASEPRLIALQAIQLGVRRLLLLDLARVGMGGGTGTEQLCKELLCEHPEIEVVAGGGVRGADDMRRLSDAGCGGVLVASALHDGRLRPELWADF
jgi:phosphoribosylformimino-5-aminoimidazole carboxamide ribotide isomerase